MDDKIMSTQKEMVEKINNALGELVRPTEQDHEDDDCPWIVFSIDDTEYALSAKYILGVAILNEVIPYAEAPAYCPGVIWDRKGMVRLLDLRVLLGRGNYLSYLKEEKSGIPMIIIIQPDGKRRGMIVDKIVVLEYVNAFIEALASEGCVQLRYIKGLLKFDSQKKPALVISPESFSTLKFENQDVKIDWKGRIDMEIKLAGLKHPSQ